MTKQIKEAKIQKSQLVILLIAFAVIGSIALLITRAAPSTQLSSLEIDKKCSELSNLKFCDDFDGASGSYPDSSKWGIASSGSSWGTHCWKKNPENVSQDGQGNLALTLVDKGSYQCDYNFNDGSSGPSNITSGYVDTNRFGASNTFKYGKFEIRAKIGCADSVWGAIWLSTGNGPGWPRSGEIDIYELGYNEKNTITQTVWTPRTADPTRASKAGSEVDHPSGQNWCDDFHVYGLNWQEDSVQFTIDGVLYNEVTPDNIPSDTYWPFNDHDMRLLIDLQYGKTGSWTGNPDPSQLPSSMLIDYVRIYDESTIGEDPGPVGQCPDWSFKGQSNGVSISEASGLIASRNNPGIYWMHNDSGGTNQIWAVDSTGKVVSRHVVGGASAVDWEDISFGPGPDSSKDYIYIGDVGDNGRSRTNARVYRVPEPTVNPADNNAQYSISSSQLNTLNVSYQLAGGGGVKPDVEAMAVDPLTGDIFFFNKSMNSRDQNGFNGMSHVFRIDGSNVNGSGSHTAAEVANVVGNVDSQSANTYPPGGTAADISSDGQMLVMQNYDEVFIWTRDGGSTFVDALNAPSDGLAPCFYQDADVSGSTIPGSEAVAFSPDGQELSFITEGSGSRIKTFENTGSTPPPPTKLATVSGLSTTPEDGQITLNWDAVNGADNYTVRWGTGGSWTTYSNDIGSNPSSNSYTVTGLTNGTTYNFSVAARDSSGTLENGDYSSAINGTPQAGNPTPTKLGDVTGLSVSEGDGQVTLDWNDVSGANNYTVRWGTGGNWTEYSNASGDSNNPTSSNYTVTGLNNGTTYNFSVAARDTTNTYEKGDYSSAVNGTPVAPQQSQPGDTDGDTDVDIADLSKLLSDWDPQGNTPGSPADFNNDGKVDVVDLSVLLSNYGV